MANHKGEFFRPMDVDVPQDAVIDTHTDNLTAKKIKASSNPITSKQVTTAAKKPSAAKSVNSKNKRITTPSPRKVRGVGF